jgi:hypothetical protein
MAAAAAYLDPHPRVLGYRRAGGERPVLARARSASAVLLATHAAAVRHLDRRRGLRSPVRAAKPPKRQIRVAAQARGEVRHARRTPGSHRDRAARSSRPSHPGYPFPAGSMTTASRSRPRPLISSRSFLFAVSCWLQSVNPPSPISASSPSTRALTLKHRSW